MLPNFLLQSTRHSDFVTTHATMGTHIVDDEDVGQVDTSPTLTAKASGIRKEQTKESTKAKTTVSVSDSTWFHFSPS